MKFKHARISAWISHRVDMVVYRLFLWRWEPRLIADPRLCRIFQDYINTWCSKHLETK